MASTTMDKWSIWIGYEPREADAFAVCRHSIKKHLTQPLEVHGIVLSDLRKRGVYTRPTSFQDGQLWDSISQAPMSTEFAISRFFVPNLAGSGWAIFMDCDILVRTNLVRLFESLDTKYAVYCVKHNHKPEGIVKMDGMAQTRYARKNWSSFCVFNCSHPANKKLTYRKLNEWPGRDLHAFKWLADDEIGELDPAYNYLVGVNSLEEVPEPKCIHYTLGVPSMPGYENCEFAEEWVRELEDWAR